MRALRIAAYSVAFAALVAVAARAQESNESRRLTYLTFSNPVEVPGMTLPAGTYRFQVANSQSSLHAVQVLSQDGSKLLTTFPTIPDIRPAADTPREAVVMFTESAPGAPPAIRTWFYANNPAGEQFVYPKKQAIAIAKANQTTVPASDDGKTITRVDANGNTVDANREREQSQVASANTAPPALPPPATSNSTTRSAAPPRVNPPANRAPAAAQTTNSAPAPQSRPRTLPQTASPFEWIGVLSLASLFCGFLAGRARQRV